MTYTSSQNDDHPAYSGSIGFHVSDPLSTNLDWITLDFSVRYEDTEHEPNPALEMDPIFQALVDHMNAFSIPDFDKTGFNAGKTWAAGQVCEPTP